jgi:asparagine synthase (glutamine-hydrolysing)
MHMSVVFGHSGAGNFLHQMADKLRHWKPDRELFWQSDELSLGCMEWDNVEDGAHYPQPYRYKHFVIAGDIRLDGRSQLKTLLELDSQEAHTDASLVVRLFERKGKDTPRFLLGDFAFVIWDTANQKLFAARDHIGIKVLYYARVGNELFFSSEIKGILVHPRVDRSFSPEFLVRSFAKADLPPGQTLYQGVQVLPPATALEFASGRLQTELYWKLGDHRVGIPEKHEERLERFKDLFYKAVEDRLRTPGNVGVELSGGLDSTGIAAAAWEIQGANHPLFAYSFAKSENAEMGTPGYVDDTEIVREFCEQRGMLPYWSRVNDKDLSEEQVLLLYSRVFDEFDSNGVPTFTGAFLGKAKKDGVKVMLSGWGGDQGVTMTVGGFYRPLAMQGKYGALWKDLRRKHGRGMSLLKSLYFAVTHRTTRPIKLRYGRNEQQLLAESPLRTDLQKRFWSASEFSKIMEVKVATDIQTYLTLYLCHPEIERRAVNHGLVGRHYSIDYRFPMLDVRLLEYLYALPLETLTYQGKSRYLFTASMAASLPTAVIEKRKSKVPTVPFFAAFQRKMLPVIEQLVAERYTGSEMSDLLSTRKIQELLASEGKKRYPNLSYLAFLLRKLDD